MADWFVAPDDGPMVRALLSDQAQDGGFAMHAPLPQVERS